MLAFLRARGFAFGVFVGQPGGLGQAVAGEALFQDIAVIPILALMPLLASGGAPLPSAEAGYIATMPGWLHAEMVMGAIAAIVFGGRYASRHVFRFIANTNLREVFTATSLAVIVGITLLMELLGLSPAMGAFVAGVVLANSEYKHTLEADIEPFKNLLLGLFFISVGMGMDFAIFHLHPLGIVGCVAALIVVKIAVMFLLGKAFRLDNAQASIFSVVMSQGGEFAFVLFQYTGSLHVMEPEQAGFLTLVVALSMATTPFLMMFASRYIMPRFMSLLPDREPDTIDVSNAVIIAGYGRFGQIIGRFLKAQGVPATILEKSAEQIDAVRKFGAEGYFGDASRLELLASAGAAKARLLVVAIDDADKALEIVRLARENFPNLKVYARARNRRHAYELDKAGAHLFIRETFDSSLRMAEAAMVSLGYNQQEIHEKAAKFRKHDEATLRKSFEFFEQEPELISFSRQASQELERILQNDIATENEEIREPRLVKA